jgi:predicted cupin superfamily sugar epimerase
MNGFNAADEIIRALSLEPHPEGGYYAETWRDSPRDGGRGTGTAIYYLLRRGELSAWHRVDAVEIWHFYAGATLRLDLSVDEETSTSLVLGPGISAGERPQAIVPALCWQSAESLGDWSLVGCTVSPAFAFSGFELAPAGWSPGGAK